MKHWHGLSSPFTANTEKQTNNNKRSILLLFVAPLLLLGNSKLMAQCEFLQPQSGIQFMGQPQHFTWKNLSLMGNIPISSIKQYSALFANCSMDSNTWLEAQVFLDFNPSSANYLDILFHFDSTLNNGWILRLGDTEDGIKLIQRKGSSEIVTLKGESGHFNKTKSNIQIRIVKQIQQIIVLYKDSSWEQFKCLGAAIDTMPLNQEYHGLGILQTGSGAAGKQMLTSFYVGPPRPDRSPPNLTKVQWIKPNQAELHFSEPITIENRNQIICEKMAADTFYLTNNRTIQAIFSPKSCNEPHRIYVQNAKDSANNIQPLQQQTAFVECETPVSPYQITFSEIMADPSPSVGLLPHTQYIELKNNTQQALWLNELTLSDHQTQIQLPKYLIPAQQYVLLVPQTDSFYRKKMPNVIPMELPYINIESDQLTLKNKTHHTVHQFNYQRYIHHPSFSNGGYSLEKPDSSCACLDPFLWQSNTQQGGTPGTTNLKTIPYPSPRNPLPINDMLFKIHIVECVGPDTVIIHFNQPLDPILWNKVKIQSTNTQHEFKVVNTQTNHHFQPNLYGASLRLTVSPALIPNQIIQAHISNAFSCMGNPLIDSQISIIFGEKPPQPTEIQFNEIMFNALEELPDFIEITNTSNKPLQLQGLQLHVVKPQQSPEIITLHTKPFTLLPKQFVCYSKNGYVIARAYNPNNAVQHVTVSNFPDLPASEATLLLVSAQQVALDQLHYNENQHSPFIQSNKGVSLEKTTPNAPSSEAAHWLSATHTVGFATPGEQNSHSPNQLARQRKINKPFQLQKTCYFMDYNDPIQLQHQFQKPGFVITATLFSMQGSRIATPLKLVEVSANGVLLIPTQPLSNYIPNGNYLLHVEAFHPDADICTQNLRLVLLRNP